MDLPPAGTFASHMCAAKKPQFSVIPASQQDRTMQEADHDQNIANDDLTPYESLIQLQTNSAMAEHFI